MQPFGHNRHGPKIGWGLCPFAEGRAGSPSNTMWLGLRPTSMPGFILINPAIWLQQTWTENWAGCARFFLGGAGSLSNTMLSGPWSTTPLPSNRHHWSSGDCLEGKGENYQVCSVQYCVQQLCTVRCTHI